MHGLFSRTKGVGLTLFFALCAGPTFLSYLPYRFTWDDAEYLSRSIAVSRAFWAGNLYGMLPGMVSFRPPMMTLLGLPWRTLATWNDLGKCFVTLDVLISLLAALCLYFLLRIGVKPVLLGAACICLLISLGPTTIFPPASEAWSISLDVHSSSTAFLADSLFAWICLASLLLVCYEWRTPSARTRGALMRGVLWGVVLSMGAMTKINHLYFVVLALPLLFILKLRGEGLKKALIALGGFAGTACLPALYLLTVGSSAIANARTSSFGSLAQYYLYPLSAFLKDIYHYSPGILLVHAIVVAILVYTVIRRPKAVLSPDALAIWIVVGFAAIILSSPNRQPRYAFPEVVALPFLAAVLLSGKRPPRRRAMGSAVLAFCVLACLSWPTRYRLASNGLGDAPAVLNYAVANHANRVLIATDSPTLNATLLGVARQVSATPDWGRIDQLARISGTATMDQESLQIRNSDLVVFQDKDKLFPPFTNLHVAEYERYVLGAGYASKRIGNDVTVYAVSGNR